MSHPLAPPPPKPGVITAIQVLLWIQFGLIITLCWCDLLIFYAVTSGSYHAGARPSPEFGVGFLLFWFLLTAALPQLVVIAVKLNSGGRRAQTPAIRMWALSVLAVPLLVLVAFTGYVAVDSDPVKMETARALAVMAALHASAPIVAIWCLLSPSARAWFQGGNPSVVTVAGGGNVDR